MAWEGSNRKATLPVGWDRIRAEVKRRADGRCEWIKVSTGKRCANAGTDADHIVRPALGGSDEYSNLRLLCVWHHRQVTAAQANDARRESQDRVKRPKVKHPGLR